MPLKILLLTAVFSTVIQTPHFIFRADKGAIGTARKLAQYAPQDRRYIQGLLGIEDPATITVIVAASDQDIKEALGFTVERWIAGLAIPSRNLVVISARGNEVFNGRQTFMHELAHIYLHHRIGPHSVPRWFDEGFAMYVSGEQVLVRLKRLLPAAATHNLIPFERLTDSFPSSQPLVHLAYAQSMMFVRYLYHHWGRASIHAFIELLSKGMPPHRAFERAFGVPLSYAEEKFKKSITNPSYVLIVLTGSGILWLLITILLLVVYMKKKRQEEELKRKWEAQQEAELIDLLSRWQGGPPVGMA